MPWLSTKCHPDPGDVEIELHPACSTLPLSGCGFQGGSDEQSSAVEELKASATSNYPLSLGEERFAPTKKAEPYITLPLQYYGVGQTLLGARQR